MSMFPARISLTLLLILLLSGAAFAAFDWLQHGRELFGGSGSDSPSNREIARGLKEALRIGSTRVVDQVGALDGFNADPQIHIPLPENLDRARSTLTMIGMGGLFDDLETRLNRAAEAAAPEAKALFWNAIEQLTLEDVEQIYKGPQDAATTYFRSRMSGPLELKMRPIVEQSLAEVGALQSYDTALGSYRKLPFVPDIKADLTGYVVDRGLAGIFFYLAKEEAAIRQDPAKRTTELLRKVFGN